jgi:hypothetical protein
LSVLLPLTPAACSNDNKIIIGRVEGEWRIELGRVDKEWTKSMGRVRQSIGRVEGEWRMIRKPGYCGYTLAIRRTDVRDGI